MSKLMHCTLRHRRARSCRPRRSADGRHEHDFDAAVEGRIRPREDPRRRAVQDRQEGLRVAQRQREGHLRRASQGQGKRRQGADALAAYENTPKARENARVALAEANYDVAIEKCDDLAGNPKDVCVKEAKSALVKGKADAKVDRVAADTRQDGAAKRADARDEASADKRDAEYKVAIEKCDALAGAAKDSCVSGAKVQFRK